MGNQIGRRLVPSAVLFALAMLLSQTNTQAVETRQDVVKIHTIQGSGSSVTDEGEVVTIEGVVTGDFQGPEELLGFFVQEEDRDQDSDSATSEGIFVFCALCPLDVNEGDVVRVTGKLGEYFGLSQLDVADTLLGEIVVQSSGNPLPIPVSVSLPAGGPTHVVSTFEALEGMLVRFEDELTVTEYFQLARYGQVVLSEGGRQRQYTNDNRPDAAGLIAHEADVASRRIILDDLNNIENGPAVVYHPQPNGFTTDNFFRGGDTVTDLTGIMHWSWAGSSGTDAWRIRPVAAYPVQFEPSNPRTAAPASVGGDITVSTLNVLNFFTTIDITSSRDSGDCGPSEALDCRGADSVDELDRQSAKLAAALAKIEADVFALVEIENNASASLAAFADGLNQVLGQNRYTYVDTGTIGSDAIKVGFIYNRETIGLFGEFQVYDSREFTDPNGTGRDRNRPALAQTFTVIDVGNPSRGERFTAVVNHFKSKGSGCGGGDDDVTTGQGNCNQTRTLAGERLVDWLANDPTGSSDPDFLILGDINAYAKEDPVIAIQNGPDQQAGTPDDYVNLVEAYAGERAYSFVFNGQWGYLDHSLANLSLTAQVTGLTIWHINADEASLLNYDDGVLDQGEFDHEAKPGNGIGLYAADPYRVSDHDPVIIGLALDQNSAPAQPSPPDPDIPAQPTPTPEPGQPSSPSRPGPVISLAGDPLNGNEGEGMLPITILLSEPAADDVVVNVSTRDGSAQAGQDYTSFSRTITFLPGEISRSINLTLVQDDLYERDEYLIVQLSDPTNGQLNGNGIVRAVILEDDPIPQVSLANAVLAESDSGMGLMTFQVELSDPAAVDLAFDYATQSGSATAGEDYVGASGRLLIPAGSLSGSIAITIMGDEQPEGDERFQITIFALSEGGIDATNSITTASGVITDDDGAPSLFLPYIWLE